MGSKLPPRIVAPFSPPRILALLVPALICAAAPRSADALSVTDLAREEAAPPGIDVEVRQEQGLPSVLLTLRIAPEAVRVRATEQGAVIALEGGDVSVPPGSPAVPGLTLRVALPEGMTATGVRVIRSADVLVSRGLRVTPRQAPRPVGGPRAPGATDDLAVRGPSGREATGEHPQPHRVTDAPDGSFPPERAVLTGQADLAGQSFAVVRVNPLRYAAATGELALATTLELALEGVWGRAPGDALPSSASGRTLRDIEAALRALVVNPDDVRVVTRPPARRGVAPGTYDYVIITPQSWIPAFAPLRDWRTRKGIRATIVTTEWIQTSGGYPGTNLEKFRGFVVDARETWGATDFLLGGDTNVIPYAVDTVTVPGYWTEDIPHDTYYADYDRDFVCEVNVGRAPVRTLEQAQTFVTKVLGYERTPPMTGWATTMGFSGFDNATPGDGYGETCKEMIHTMHVPPEWTLDTEYDDEPGSHRADVLAQFQSGTHIINHHDHCSSGQLGVGWVCHNETLTIPNMSDLMNVQRQSLCFAIGCYPANYTLPTCIAEAFVRNPHGGGVAFVGNAATGWGGSLGDPDWYSARQDRFFHRNLFDDGFTYLGANFTDLKNDEYDPDDPDSLHRFCFWELSLLGDPAMPVWTADPGELLVQHPDTAFVGLLNAFPVTVASPTGLPDSATVCIWKGDEIYEVAETGTGTVVFELTPATAGTLLVTVWAKDHLPYEASVRVRKQTSIVEEEPAVLPGELALLSVSPNPFSGSAAIALAVPAAAGRVTVRIYNVAGERVRTVADRVLPPGERVLNWDGRSDEGETVAGGVYFCDIEGAGTRAGTKLVLMR